MKALFIKVCILYEK